MRHNTGNTIEDAKQFMRDFEEKNLNKIFPDKVDTGRFEHIDYDAISLPEKSKLTREDVNAISLPEEKKKEIKELDLNSKISLLTERQRQAFIERIVDELETEEFLYQVRQGFYDNEPELKEQLVQGFMAKEQEKRQTKPRISSRRRMR